MAKPARGFAGRRSSATLGNSARTLRIRKGLTQYDAGLLIGKSQAYASKLEKGLLEADSVREYVAAIEKAPSRARTPGGLYKAGRVKHMPEGRVDPTAFRGEPLRAGFDYEAALPPGRDWKILAICRTAPKTELAFLAQESEQDDVAPVTFGIVGFHLVAGEVRRSQIIRIAEDYREAASEALHDFADELDWAGDEDDGDDESEDDAFVSDDED